MKSNNQNTRKKKWNGNKMSRIKGIKTHFYKHSGYMNDSVVLCIWCRDCVCLLPLPYVGQITWKLITIIFLFCFNFVFWYTDPLWWMDVEWNELWLFECYKLTFWYKFSVSISAFNTENIALVLISFSIQFHLHRIAPFLHSYR